MNESIDSTCNLDQCASYRYCNNTERRLHYIHSGEKNRIIKNLIENYILGPNCRLTKHTSMVDTSLAFPERLRGRPWASLLPGTRKTCHSLPRENGNKVHQIQ